MTEQPKATTHPGKRTAHMPRKLKPTLMMISLLAVLMSGIAQAQDTTITFWNIWGGTRTPQLREILDRFEAQNPGIKVESVVLDSSVAQQQMIAAVAAGTAPDLYMTSAYELTAWADLGGFVRPLDDFIAADQLDLSQYLKAAAIQGSTVDGEVLQLPFKLSTPMMIWFNKELFVEAGLDPNDPPQTWSELHDAAVALSKTNGRVIEQLGLNVCINCSDTGPENAFAEWNATNNGALIDESGRDVAFDETGAETLEFMTRLMDESVGGFNNMAAQMGVDWSSQRPAFYEGKIAMHMDGTWFLDILRQEAPEMLDNVGVFLLPYNDANEGATHRGLVHGVPGYLIPAGASHPEEAWELLKFIALEQDGACSFFQMQRRADSPLLECAPAEGAEPNPFQETFESLINTTEAVAAPPAYNNVHLRLKEMQDSVLRGVESIDRGLESAAQDVRQLLAE